MPGCICSPLRRLTHSDMTALFLPILSVYTRENDRNVHIKSTNSKKKYNRRDKATVKHLQAHKGSSRLNNS